MLTFLFVFVLKKDISKSSGSFPEGCHFFINCRKIHEILAGFLGKGRLKGFHKLILK